MKIRIKISKSNNRTATKPKNLTSKRAADDEVFDMGSLQDQDIHLWANGSMSSVASSVTAPPSQTASFYKRVLKQEFTANDTGSRYMDDDDDDDLDNTTLRSDDNDNCSFDESLSKGSRDGGGDPSSVAAVQTKKKKKGGLWRIRHKKKFGNGSIQEFKDEDEISRSNRGRSLFQDSSDTLSLAQGSEAPTITRVKTKRRGSIGGGVSSGKSISSSDDDRLARELGYEDAEPSSRKETPRRRGSLGALFARQEEEEPRSEPRRRRHSLVASGTPTSALDALSGAPSSRSKQSKWISSRLLGKDSTVALKDKDMYWLINQERLARNMRPFTRDFVLDTLAKSMASEIVVGIQPTSNEYHGNVGCGKSLEHIHKSIMADMRGSSRKNILSETFSDFGVAVIVGRDRQLYMVTLFQ